MTLTQAKTLYVLAYNSLIMFDKRWKEPKNTRALFKRSYKLSLSEFVRYGIAHGLQGDPLMAFYDKTRRSYIKHKGNKSY